MKNWIALLLLIALAWPGAAGAQALALDTYVNPRFQYSIKYPIKIFLPQGESPNRDGQRFVSRDGQAVLTVWGSHNALDQTLAEKRREAVQRFGGRLTYQVMKHDWFAISGRSDQRIFFQKTFLKNDMFKTFTLEYPVEQRDLYDPLVEVISSSFTGR